MPEVPVLVVQLELPVEHLLLPVLQLQLLLQAVAAADFMLT